MLTEKVDEPKWLEALKGYGAEWRESRKMCRVIKCCAFHFIELADLARSHWGSQYYYLWMLLPFLIHGENYVFITRCQLLIFFLPPHPSVVSLFASSSISPRIWKQILTEVWLQTQASGHSILKILNMALGSHLFWSRWLKMKETLPAVYFELHNNSFHFSYLCLIKTNKQETFFTKTFFR